MGVLLFECCWWFVVVVLVVVCWKCCLCVKVYYFVVFVGWFVGCLDDGYFKVRVVVVCFCVWGWLVDLVRIVLLFWVDWLWYWCGGCLVYVVRLWYVDLCVLFVVYWFSVGCVVIGWLLLVLYLGFGYWFWCLLLVVSGYWGWGYWRFCWKRCVVVGVWLFCVCWAYWFCCWWWSVMLWLVYFYV